MAETAASARPRVRPLPLFLALAIGALGGWIAAVLGTPLPWMIGAMTATTVAALSRVPVAMSSGLRSVMIIVLGVMLGGSFSPEIVAQMPKWWPSLTTLAAYTVVASAAGFLYYRHWAGYDRVTAYFSATPGGLAEMIVAGTEMGGDSRFIALNQVSRLLLIVLALPFGFQLFLGYEPAARGAPGPAILDMSLSDMALLTACGIAGFFGAKALKIPAATLVGPMILSIGVHLAGWTEASPPNELVAAAQVVIGTAIGCRFAGTSLRLIGRTVVLAVGATAILLVATFAFAFGLSAATELPLNGLILAFSPGGFAEMSLIALAMTIDAAFVATHHFVRITLIVIFAPVLFRLLGRRDPVPRA